MDTLTKVTEQSTKVKFLDSTSKLLKKERAVDSEMSGSAHASSLT